MDSKPVTKGWLLGILGVAAAFLVVIATVLVLVTRGGEEKTAVAGIKPGFEFQAAPTPNAALVKDLERITSDLPRSSGTNDRERIRSMLGAPDSFVVSFELAEGGRSDAPVRYETWFYFGIETAFEFADGSLLSNLPVDDVPALSVLPRQYDPEEFGRGMTFEDVAKLVESPESFSRVDAPQEFGAAITAYYGEQLFLAFEAGGLAYVETFVLSGGGE